MKTNYQYPLADEWNIEEIIQVTTFFRAVEDAYELSQGVNRESLLQAYSGFKTIVTSKAEEKQLDREFEQLTDYSLYLTVKAARETASKNLRMLQ